MARTFDIIIRVELDDDEIPAPQDNGDPDYPTDLPAGLIDLGADLLLVCHEWGYVAADAIQFHEVYDVKEITT